MQKVSDLRKPVEESATDTGRLARILSILEEAAQRLQFFILTHHPERYRGLSEGEFYDLEGILSHKPAQS